MLGHLVHDIHAFELIEVDDMMNSCPPHDHVNALSAVESLHAQEGIRAVMTVTDRETLSATPGRAWSSPPVGFSVLGRRDPSPGSPSTSPALSTTGRRTVLSASYVDNSHSQSSTYLLTGTSKFVPEVMARMVQAPIAHPELQRLLAWVSARRRRREASGPTSPQQAEGHWTELGGCKQGSFGHSGARAASISPA